ncbi:MAG TPA: PEP-CTERM sorting domain-containing protein [Candidatus Acidoferrum sp.]|nr:PEP-CTERM sorting domain-containing protein [Candidatus Acidoferrum sp.]
MKISRLLVLVAFMGISCSAALADGTDPVMKLGGGGNSEILTTNTFSFSFTQTNPPQTSFFIDFINNTGTRMTALDLLITGSAGLVFTCDNTIDPYFTNCGSSIQDSGQYLISFFGLDATHLGIPFATKIKCEDGEDGFEDDDDGGPTTCTATPILSDFGITVGVGDMAPGQSFSVAGTLVAPEPSSVVLLLAGGLLLLLYKRSAFAI